LLTQLGGIESYTPLILSFPSLVFRLDAAAARVDVVRRLTGPLAQTRLTRPCFVHPLAPPRTAPMVAAMEEATVATPATVRLWDVRSGRSGQALPCPAACLDACAFGVHGRRFLALVCTADVGVYEFPLL
jgi:hypothetical protein